MVAAALNNNNSGSEERTNSHHGDEKASLIERKEDGLEKEDGMTMTVKTSKNPLDTQKEQQHEQQEKQLLLKNTAAGPHVLLSSSVETPTSIIDETLFSQQQRLKRKAGELPIKTKFVSASTLRAEGDGSEAKMTATTTTTTTTTTILTSTIVAAEFDENGVRKSKRSVKPKILFDDTEDYERINTYERPGSSNKKNKRGNSKGSSNNNKENGSTKKRKMESAAADKSNAGAAAAVVKIDFEELRAKRAYIGKKVEVFWIGEQVYHRGTIVNYDQVVKRHCVKYDMVKRENEGVLDYIDIEADTLEWCDADDEKDENKNNTTKTKKSKSKVTLPAQGKMSEIVTQMSESWPKVGAHVWGRVKGHGWWPGVCKGKESSATRTIAFFDDSTAKCLRADLVPYNTFFDVLKKSKASKSYENAVKRSMESAEKNFTERLKKRVARKQEEFAEIRKKYAALTKKRQEQQTTTTTKPTSVKNKSTHNTKSKKGITKHNINTNNKVIKIDADLLANVDLNGNSSAARLARLGKHFDALKDRVAPLAIAASQHLRVQLQLQEYTGGENRMAQMTERERVILLEELESLKSFLVTTGRHLEVINAENPEDVAMFGYDDDFDNQIANATFMTVGGDDVVGKTGEEENLDDPDEVEDGVDDDDDVIVDDDMITDLGLSGDDIVDKDDNGDDEKTVNPEEATNIADALDPTPLDALLFQEEEEEEKEEEDYARGEQPKTPHYPTRDEEENELKHTSSDDRTERNDSDDNDASLPLNENSKSIGGDAKDCQEEEVRNTASKVAI
ncbi:unnamed protein product [Bathycoccus prasinos]